MTADELWELPPGTTLYWVSGRGENEVRHPAKLLKHMSRQVGVLVYFVDKQQRKIRWSRITNQPVGESQGYVGSVKLELRV